MKWLCLIILTSLLLLSGCTDKREQALQLREKELKQKEQELTFREQAVQLKENELNRREDSTNKNAVDTLAALFPTVPGMWNVTMRCTETTCPGSAVGDTKTEQWEISIQNNTLVVKAMSDKKLLRIYSGTYIGNVFELTAQQENVEPQQAANMVVRLQPTKENEMTGQRVIIRPNDCRIVYALDLKKQQ